MGLGAAAAPAHSPRRWHCRIGDVGFAALVAALLPGCPAAAEGGLVPTAASIRDAAALAARRLPRPGQHRYAAGVDERGVRWLAGG